MTDFLGKAVHLAIVEYEGDSDEMRKKTLQAVEECKAVAPWAVYNALHNNCEHIALFCRTGRYCDGLSLQQILDKDPPIVHVLTKPFW
jgi:hypothetical protein